MASLRSRLVVIIGLSMLFLGLISAAGHTGEPIWLIELIGDGTLWRIQVGLVGISGLSFLALALQILSSG